MIDPAKVAIRSTTQDHLDIEDIMDGIVILKDGGACLIISTNAINFDLLSEREQEAMIYAYAGLLNSLNFPIQLVLRSQRKDISAYLRLLTNAEVKAPNTEIKTQIRKYREFITDTVQKNRVLDKKFYLVVPMSSLELGIAQTLGQMVKKTRKLPFDKEYILKKAQINLFPKRDHVLRLLSHLGLSGRQLNTQELIQMFFNIYNPALIGQSVSETEQYQTPMVEISLTGPNITPPAPAKSPAAPPPPPVAVTPPSVQTLPPVTPVAKSPAPAAPAAPTPPPQPPPQPVAPTPVKAPTATAPVAPPVVTPPSRPAAPPLSAPTPPIPSAPPPVPPVAPKPVISIPPPTLQKPVFQTVPQPVASQPLPPTAPSAAVASAKGLPIPTPSPVKSEKPVFTGLPFVQASQDTPETTIFQQISQLVENTTE